MSPIQEMRYPLRGEQTRLHEQRRGALRLGLTVPARQICSSHRHWRTTLTRKLLIATAFLLFALPAIWLLANYVGVCLKTGRISSEQDKKEAAIGYVISNMGRYVKLEQMNGRSEIRVPEDVDRYESVDHFLQANPGCCEVRNRGTDGYTPGLYQKLRGRYCSTVIVKYKIKYKFEGIWHTAVQVRNVAIANCGDPWSGNLR